MHDRDLMLLAIEKADEGVGRGGSPFGACIARNGEIVACEHNRVWQDADSTAHAEIVAIRKACGALKTVDLSGCAIYSTTEPCPMCFAACHWAKISRIVFGARIEDARQYGFTELAIGNKEMKKIGGSPIEVEGDFMRPEALALFERWLARPDRKTY